MNTQEYTKGHSSFHIIVLYQTYLMDVENILTQIGSAK